MIDLNSFKAINDHYGHKEGDEALARTAAVLKKATAERPAFLVRVGGDEFAVILSGVREQEVWTPFRIYIRQWKKQMTLPQELIGFHLQSGMPG